MQPDDDIIKYKKVILSETEFNFIIDLVKDFLDDIDYRYGTINVDESELPKNVLVALCRSEGI